MKQRAEHSTFADKASQFKPTLGLNWKNAERWLQTFEDGKASAQTSIDSMGSATIFVSLFISSSLEMSMHVSKNLTSLDNIPEQYIKIENEKKKAFNDMVTNLKSALPNPASVLMEVSLSASVTIIISVDSSIGDLGLNIIPYLYSDLLVLGGGNIKYRSTSLSNKFHAGERKARLLFEKFNGGELQDKCLAFNTNDVVVAINLLGAISCSIQNNNGINGIRSKLALRSRLITAIPIKVMVELGSDILRMQSLGDISKSISDDVAPLKGKMERNTLPL